MKRHTPSPPVPGPASVANREKQIPLSVTALITCSLAADLSVQTAEAGKARDCLNAPVDTWVTFYNFGHSESVAPVVGGAEFGIADATSDILSQSFILTRIVDAGAAPRGLKVEDDDLAFEMGESDLMAVR